MLIKMGGSGGDGISAGDKPKITFDGKWLPWHIEFYSGEPYWEAWLLTSGALTLEKTYVLDAWGIGGGGAVTWSRSGGRAWGGTGGAVGLSYGLSLSGTLAVTIGAGAINSGTKAGGNTSLGNLLTCAGGATPTGKTASGDPNRYRFTDPEHIADMGADVTSSDGIRSAGGWLPIPESMDDGSAGQGFGGGGGYGGYTKSGALVIRIKI